MPSVFFDNPYNSTFFTTCCQVAICDDQANCPMCHAVVLPRSGKDRWAAARERAWWWPKKKEVE